MIIKIPPRNQNNGQFMSIDHDDIINQRFGKLKVLSIHHTVGRHYYYECKCECGNTCIKERSALINRLNLQCMDCYNKEKIDNIIKDMIDKRFGRLKVKEFDHLEPRKNKLGRNAHLFFFKCECDCGNICIIDKNMLMSGSKQSCGCLQSEAARERVLTHGMSKTKFYQKWNNMIDRCNNSNNDSYMMYGGRGITVCNRWRSFENFRDDMYESYLKHVQEFGEADTTIERINVNGNYEPSNCTWATRAEQNRNMTTNFRLIYNGQEYIAANLHRMFVPSIMYNSFHDRLKAANYNHGDIINNETCYNNIFRGTHIIKPIEVENKSNIISPIEFIDNITISPIELIERYHK